jgi:hypothetical protein
MRGGVTIAEGMCPAQDGGCYRIGIIALTPGDDGYDDVQADLTVERYARAVHAGRLSMTVPQTRERVAISWPAHAFAGLDPVATRIIFSFRHLPPSACCAVSAVPAQR